MNQLINTKVFNFNDKQIRTINIKGKPWFIGKDVARILGYKNISRDIQRHVDNEDKAKYQNSTLDKYHSILIINEAGVYALIFGSKLPAAHKFKNWVTHEVLPAIRKTGSYAKPNYRLPRTYLEAMELATASLRKNKEMQPKVDEYNKFIKNPGTMTITSIAKDFGMSAHELNMKLHHLNIIYRNGKTWYLYKKYQNMGLAHYNEYRNGLNQVVSVLMKWTTKGKKFIYDLLKSQGIHLLTEKQGFGNHVLV